MFIFPCIDSISPKFLSLCFGMCFFKRFSLEVSVILAWPFILKWETPYRKLKLCVSQGSLMVGRPCVGALKTGFEGPQITEFVDVWTFSSSYFSGCHLAHPYPAGPAAPNTKPLAKPLRTGTRLRSPGVLLPGQTFSLSSLPLLFPRTYGPRA